MVDDGWTLTVRVAPVGDDDQDTVAVLLPRLRAELLDLDLDAVEPIADAAPAAAKAGVGSAAALGVRLGGVGTRLLVTRVRDWAARNGRSVELTIDGDTIKVTGVSQAVQEQLIDVWLAKHATGR